MRARAKDVRIEIIIRWRSFHASDSSEKLLVALCSSTKNPACEVPTHSSAIEKGTELGATAQQLVRRLLPCAGHLDDIRWCGVLTYLPEEQNDPVLEVNIFDFLIASEEQPAFEGSSVEHGWVDPSRTSPGTFCKAKLEKDWLFPFLDGSLSVPIFGTVTIRRDLVATERFAIAPSIGDGDSCGTALIVTTVSFLHAPDCNARPLESFIRYHLRKGFHRIMVFVDDSLDEASLDALRRFPCSRVICRLRGEDLFEEQRNCCPSFKTLSPLAPTDVSARQMLDAELAMYLAPSLECSWVLSLDSDELFFTREASVRPHFERLVQQEVDQMTYLNHEGVPESEDTGDYFFTTTLFRLHHFAVPLTNTAREGLRFWMDRSARRQYMLFYDNGKSACRAGLGATPRSQHLWRLPANQRSCTALADPRNLDIKGYRECTDPCILHFPVCGLSWFVAKYRTLGNFPDTWLGKIQQPPSLHSDCRDLYATGGEEALARKFRDEILLQSEQEISRQLNCGTCQRMQDHAIILDALPPKAAIEQPQAPGDSVQVKIGECAGAIGTPPVAQANAGHSTQMDAGPLGIERGWILSKTLAFL